MAREKEGSPFTPDPESLWRFLSSAKGGTAAPATIDAAACEGDRRAAFLEAFCLAWRRHKREMEGS